MAAPDDLPRMTFATKAEWERWLAANHGEARGVWLQLTKKGASAPSVSRAEALEVALCYGWIDGQARSLDQEHWLQRFTPRTARSKWSKINCEAAEALIAAGKMKPAGLAQVEAAKRDGRWERAYAPPSRIEVPEDLRRALARYPKARRAFEGLKGQNRYAILYRIHDAKKPETRARRIAQFVQMLREGKTIY